MDLLLTIKNCNLSLIKLKLISMSSKIHLSLGMSSTVPKYKKKQCTPLPQVSLLPPRSILSGVPQNCLSCGTVIFLSTAWVLQPNSHLLVLTVCFFKIVFFVIVWTTWVWKNNNCHPYRCCKSKNSSCKTCLK